MPKRAAPYVIITSRMQEESFADQVADYVLEYEYEETDVIASQ